MAEAPPPPALTPEQLQRVGQRIWQNECGGTVAGLTSWNNGEGFASLGIGHFIWYPEGKRGPFEESFPALVAHLEAHRVAMPTWTKGPCPWPTKAAFDAAREDARQVELREVLSRTTELQTSFIIARLQKSLPKMLGQTKKPALVRANFDLLKQTPEGAFCLIDYVNFKGEGTNRAERYQGQGWGLMQVLEEMGPPAVKDTGHPARFAEAAKRVLTRRVQNAPAARKEGRWLAGWHNRCAGYKSKL